MNANTCALVLDTLKSATSQEPELIKPLEEKLQEWEAEPGFYSFLLNVLSSHSNNVNMRWLALSCLTKGIEQRWYRSNPRAFSEEDRQILRQGLLESTLSEPEEPIGTKMAEIIARVGSYDHDYWCKFVADLMKSVMQSLQQRRSLQILNYLIQQPVSKQLFTMAECEVPVFPTIMHIWQENTDLFLKHSQDGATDLMTEPLQKAVLSVKILRSLVCYGRKSQDIVTFLTAAFDKVKTGVECRKLLKDRGIQQLEVIEQFFADLLKVAVEVITYYPHSYVSLIQPSLEFVLHYCFTEKGVGLVYENFTLQCMNILRSILSCWTYKRDPTAVKVVSEVLHGLVCGMCELFVSRYLVLSAAELQLWDAAPERFATAGVNLTLGEDELEPAEDFRLCVEATFTQLYESYKEVMEPQLLKLLRSVPESTSHDLPAILNKDAVYNAVGLTFSVSNDTSLVDFDEWFSNVLSRELKIKDANYRVIRRRICKLIGQWGTKHSESLQPEMYEALLEPLTDSDEDVAVKLAAAEAFKDISFNEDMLEPFVPHILPALGDLLAQCSEDDAKALSLAALCEAVVAGRGGASAGAAAVCARLRAVGARALRHDALRANTLRLLPNLIKILNECPDAVRSFAVDMVEGSLGRPLSQHGDTRQNTLDLWLALLRSAPVLEPPLLQLADHLPAIFNETTDDFYTMTEVLRTYAVLCPEEFFQGAGGRCMQLLHTILRNTRPEQAVPILKAARTCFSLGCSESNAELGVKVTWPIVTLVIEHILERGESEELIQQLCLLSQTVLRSPDLFYQAIEEANKPSGCDAGKAVGTVVGTFTDNMNDWAMTSDKKRKLMALALLTLVTTKNVRVLQHFSAILHNVTKVLSDVVPKDTLIDRLVGAAKTRQASGKSLYAECRAHVAVASPAYTVDLRAYTLRQLETLKGQVGVEGLGRLLRSTDQETLHKLQQHIPLDVDLSSFRQMEPLDIETITTLLSSHLQLKGD